MNLDTSQRVFAHFSTRVDSFQEEVWVAALTTQLTVIEDRLIFRGTVDSCLVHPRDIFRFLIKQNASCFMLIHTHPHGDPAPSSNDHQITKRLATAGRLLEIPLIDHVILAADRYFSFADYGYVKNRRLKS